MTGRNTLIILAILLIMGIWVSQSGVPDTDSEKEAKPKQLAPDFALRDINGKIVKLSDYKGKLVAVNFWATWCPSCRWEIPGFVNVQEKFRDRGFVILGICKEIDNDSGVKEFARQNNINYPVLFSTSKMESAYGGIRAIPTTFIISTEGFILLKGVGGIDEKEFTKVIEYYLPKKSIW